MKPDILKEISEVAPYFVHLSHEENLDKAMPAAYFENLQARMISQAKTLHSLQPKASTKNIESSFLSRLLVRIFSPIPSFAMALVVGVIALVSFYEDFPPTDHTTIAQIEAIEVLNNSDFDIEEFLDEDVEEDLI
jgi:hypothetical protein